MTSTVLAYVFFVLVLALITTPFWTQFIPAT